MQAFFSSDGSFVVQFLVIFLVILVLLIGAVLLFRRLSGRGMSLAAGANARGRQPRLGIVDIYELDRQRQLILLRRDNVEHLLLVGGPNDVVIERHIQRGAGARYAPEPEPGADPAVDAARAEKFLDSPAPPAFAMPEVVPPAVPGAEPPHPERTPPLDPGLFEPEVVSPARARPASPVSRLIRRTPPPLAGAAAEAAPSGPSPAAAPVAAGMGPPAAPPVSEPPPEPPPVIAGRGPRPVDPAVLSDMARQLQVALKRPSSAVTPPPGGAEVPPLPPAPDLRPDPLAAAMAAAQAEPPAPAPARPAAASTPPAPATPAPAKPPSTKPPSTKPSPATPAPDKPAQARPAEAAPPPAPEAGPKPLPSSPAPAPTPPAPAPTGPAEADPGRAEPVPATPAGAAPEPATEPKPGPAAPADATAQNPFSVEEIEAEFARLLGRPLDNKG